MVEWANTFGPAVATLVAGTLEKFKHPEQGYRACLGIIRLAKEYGANHTNAACARAIAASPAGVPHRSHVESILRHGLDRAPPSAPASRSTPLDHANVRGADYYDRKEGLH